mgnify:CR=1 FL=1
MSEDWRTAMIDRARAIILSVDADIVEEQKWQKPSNPAGVPTWSCHGILCTGERYKDKVKFTFMHGAALPDPAGLFVPQEGGTRRAIDVREGDALNEAAFKALVKAAVERNRARG